MRFRDSPPSEFICTGTLLVHAFHRFCDALSENPTRGGLFFLFKTDCNDPLIRDAGSRSSTISRKHEIRSICSGIYWLVSETDYK